MTTTKHYSFEFPLTQRKVNLNIKGGWETTVIGNLNVTGLAKLNTNYSKIDVDNRYTFDILSAHFNGLDLWYLIDSADLFEYCKEELLKKAHMEAAEALEEETGLQRCVNYVKSLINK